MTTGGVHPVRPGRLRLKDAGRVGGLGVLLAVTLVTAAHGPDDEQLRVLTAQLERHPDDITARLRRGELLREHVRLGDSKSLTEAREDYAYVLRIRPNLLTAQLGMVRLDLATGEPTNALSRLDRMLSGTEQIATVHQLRGEALMKCHRPAEAAAAFTTALAHQKDPRAETFLARARAQLAMTPPDYPAVLAGLDTGLDRLGPVPGMQLLALDVALRAGRYTDALQRVDALAAESDRKESWLSRRGDILKAAGRPAEAMAAWQQALKACQEMPAPRKTSPAIRELQEELSRKLAPKSDPQPETRPQ